MVVSREFLSFEELDRCLVKLQDNNLMQKSQALYVLGNRVDVFCQLGNAVYFIVFVHKPMFKRPLSLQNHFQLFTLVIALLYRLQLSFFHLVLLRDCEQDRFKVKNLKFEPSVHSFERILHLLRHSFYLAKQVFLRLLFKH